MKDTYVKYDLEEITKGISCDPCIIYLKISDNIISDFAVTHKSLLFHGEDIRPIMEHGESLNMFRESLSDHGCKESGFPMKNFEKLSDSREFKKAKIKMINEEKAIAQLYNQGNVGLKRAEANSSQNEDILQERMAALDKAAKHHKDVPVSENAQYNPQDLKDIEERKKLVDMLYTPTEIEGENDIGQKPDVKYSARQKNDAIRAHTLREILQQEKG